MFHLPSGPSPPRGASPYPPTTAAGSRRTRLPRAAARQSHSRRRRQRRPRRGPSSQQQAPARRRHVCVRFHLSLRAAEAVPRLQPTRIIRSGAAVLEWRHADELPQLPAPAGAAAATPGAALPPSAPAAVARARRHGRGRTRLGGAPGRFPPARARGAVSAIHCRLQGLLVFVVLLLSAAFAVRAGGVRLDADAAVGRPVPRGGHPASGGRDRPRAAPRAGVRTRCARGTATLGGSTAVIRCGPGPPGCHAGSTACLGLVLRGSVLAAVGRAAAFLGARDVPSPRLVRCSIPLFAERADRTGPDISPTALCRRPVPPRFRGTTHCQHASLQLRRRIGRTLRRGDAEASIIPAPRLRCRRQRAGVGGCTWPDVLANCPDSSTLSTRASAKFAALCQASCESCAKWTTPHTAPFALDVERLSQRISLQTLMYHNRSWLESSVKIYPELQLYGSNFIIEKLYRIGMNCQSFKDTNIYDNVSSKIPLFTK